MYFRSDYFQGMFSSGWMEGGESHNLKLPIKVIKGVPSGHDVWSAVKQKRKMEERKSMKIYENR